MEAGCIIPESEEFIAACYRVRGENSALAVPAPGAVGHMRFRPRAPVTYEFRPALSWEPLAKAALLFLAVMRHDLQVSLITGDGLLPRTAALQAIRDGAGSTVKLACKPEWPTEGFAAQFDLRVVREAADCLRVAVGVYGVVCDNLLLHVTGGSEPLEAFWHYVALPDQGTEWLYDTEEEYRNRSRGTPMHLPEIGRAVVEDLRKET